MKWLLLVFMSQMLSLISAVASSIILPPITTVITDINSDQSTYKVIYQPSTAHMAAMEYIRIVFPNSSPSTTITVAAFPSCSPVSVGALGAFLAGSAGTLVCVKSSGALHPNSVEIQLKSSSSTAGTKDSMGYGFYEFEINSGITNGPIGMSVGGITCQGLDSAWAILETSASLSVTFTANDLNGPSALAKNKVQLSYLATKDITAIPDSTMKFSVTTMNDIVPLGSVTIQMPKSNINYFNYGAINKNTFIFNTAVVSSSVTVTYDGVNVGIASVVLDLDKPTANSDIISIKLSNPAALIQDKVLEVSISGIRTPPTTQPINGFQFKTGNADFKFIDMQETAIVAVIAKPNSFMNDAATGLTSSAKILGTGTDTTIETAGVTYQFQISINADVALDSFMKIQLPLTWPVQNGVTNGPPPTLYCNQICSGGLVTAHMGQNAYYLRGLFTNYVYAPGPIKFELRGNTNPADTIVQILNVGIYQTQGNDFKVEESSQLFNLTFMPGALTINSIQVNDTSIGSHSVSYIFSFVIQHQIQSTYAIKLQFPKEIGVIMKSGCNIVSAQATDLVTCSTDPTYNQIVINRLAPVSTPIPAGTSVYLKVDSIINPFDYVNPGPIVVSTIKSNGGQIDSGSYILAPNQFKKSAMKSFKVRALNFDAGMFPVRYQFEIVPVGKIVKGAYLIVYFPPDIYPHNKNKMIKKCNMQWMNITGFSDKKVTCKYDQNNNSIAITNGFTTANSVDDPPMLKFQLDEMTNPRGIQISGDFNVTIFNKDDKILYWHNNTFGPNVTMVNASYAQLFTYTRTSDTNGVPINVTFQIKATNWLETGDIITIKLPYPVHFTDSSTCTGKGYWLNGNLKCNFSGDLTTVRVNVSVVGRYGRMLEKEDAQPQLDWMSEDEDEEDDQETVEEYEDWNTDMKPHRGRKLIAEKIPSNTLMILEFTNIQVQQSQRPTYDNITYNVTTKMGKPLEYNLTNLKFQNQQASVLNRNTAGISPNWWEKGRLANYTISFIPINYEQNMTLEIELSKYVKVPQTWNNTCRGVVGVDKENLTCKIDWYNHTISIYDAFSVTKILPEKVVIVIENLINPTQHIVTDSFKIKTRTAHDWYTLDYLDQDLNLNFFCTFPCQTCNTTQKDQCYSCYSNAATDWVYLHEYQCLDQCPNGLFETFTNITEEGEDINTCNACNSPCSDCKESADSCHSCITGYLLFDVEHTCYEEILWSFPYLTLTVVSIAVSWMADCYHNSTNILHASVFFISFLEVIAIFQLCGMYADGQIPGDRALSLTSFIIFFLLNLCFMVAHIKSFMQTSSLEYRRVRKDYKYTFWFINGVSYSINFKAQLMLISEFAGLARFSGTFNSESWQKFNIFTVCYVLLVYLPFVGDFYLFFMSHGLRRLGSYIAGELVIMQTILALILILEILNECNCFGMKEANLGKRQGLYKNDKKKKGDDKRKELRSGMGNEESSYGSESYDSEDDNEMQAIELKPRVVPPQKKRVLTPPSSSSSESEDISEEESSSSVESSVSSIKPKIKTPIPTPPREATPIREATPSPKGPTEAEKTLQQLALDMKADHERVEAERQRIIEKETLLIKEQGNWRDETNSIRNDINSIKEDRQKISEEVDQRIADKLAGIDGNPRKTPAGHWIIELPFPVFEELDYQRELDGDEEYWLQNLSGIHGDASARSQINEKDGSVVEFIEKEDAVLRDDITARKSRVGTEKEGMNMSQSALYSNNDGNSYMGKSNMGRNRDGSELQHMEERSADFGDASNLDGYDKSAYDKSFEKPKTPIPRSTTPPPMMDKDGHSDESSEGMVANHDPFKGIEDAIEKQEEMRKSLDDPFTPTETEEAKETPPRRQIPQEIPPVVQQQEIQQQSEDEDNRPSGRRRLKQVLYSDKSESSVDDMMEDTPSNYNIANGRLEGKSMGLKAILLYAKNQGIKLGDQGQLPQIQEENNGDDNQQWKNINHPMHGVGSTHIVGDNVIEQQHIKQNYIQQVEDSRVIQQSYNLGVQDDSHIGRHKMKRNPVQKQFLEPKENAGMTPLKKNNFIQQ